MCPELDIAVILPVFNGAATIKEQLTALASQEWDGSWEVLVVNNGSTDDTGAIVKAFAAKDPGRFRIEVADARHNLSYVRNEGVRRTSSRSVVFCDADDVVGEGWLAGLAHALEDHELVGSRLDYARLNGAGSGPKHTFQTTSVETIFRHPAIAGCGLGCHRSLWERLGGNDERILAEDTDFSIRAHLLGVTAVLADAVYHYRLRDETRSAFGRGMRQARSEAQIFKEYGSEDQRPSMRSAIRRWQRAASSVRGIRTPDGRLRAMRLLGGVAGRVWGSVEFRTRYL